MKGFGDYDYGDDDKEDQVGYIDYDGDFKGDNRLPDAEKTVYYADYDGDFEGDNKASKSSELHPKISNSTNGGISLDIRPLIISVCNKNTNRYNTFYIQ